MSVERNNVITKDKLRIYLEMMLINADENGKLTISQKDICGILKINIDIGRSMNFLGYFKKSQGREFKEITYKEITEEMIDSIHKSHREKYSKKDGFNLNTKNDDLEKILKYILLEVQQTRLKVDYIEKVMMKLEKSLL
jgi:hypothetical protein